MAKPRLHLDADASEADLEQELLKRGHDVTRTPNEWMKSDADDEIQLRGAAEHGRTIFTFNTKHFAELAQRIIRHAGIILSPQKKKNPKKIFKALDRFFKETTAEEMENQTRWLSDWEEKDKEEKK